MATKTWTQTSGNLASTDANWSGGTKPIEGDDVVFDATSVANCTFDLSLTLGSFTIAATYSGVITQAASFSVTSFTMGGGTFTGATAYTLTCSGALTKTAGTWTGAVTRLTMSADDCTISSNAVWSFRSVTINGNTTATTSNITVYELTTIAAGKTLTVTGITWICNDDVAATTFTNNGSVDGTGTMRFYSWTRDTSLKMGVLDCDVSFQISASSAASRTFTMTGDAVIGRTLTVASLHATNTCTLSHGTNYVLDVSGATTLGTRGIITQGTGIFTLGSYVQSGASSVFTQGADIGVAGDITISDGTFTGDTDYTIWYGGDYTESGGSVTGTFTAKSAGISSADRWPDAIIGYLEGAYYAIDCKSGELIASGGHYAVREATITAINTGVVGDKTVSGEIALDIYSGGVLYVSENDGTSTGTGAEQTIAHGLSSTPSYVSLTEYDTGGALAYESTAADATNIYVTATSAKTYRWKVEI